MESFYSIKQQAVDIDEVVDVFDKIYDLTASAVLTISYTVNDDENSLQSETLDLSKGQKRRELIYKNW